jgi:hypothetical protein
MSVSWEFGVPLTPSLTDAGVPLFGTNARRSDRKKRKKMQDIGRLL